MKIHLTSPLCTLPSYAHDGDAGMDLTSIQSGTIAPHGRGVFNTGVICVIPKGDYGKVSARSGLAVKYGIDVGAGIIDSGYRGEIKVVLFNHSDEPFNVSIGMKIAQLIIMPCRRVAIEHVKFEQITNTVRGTDGFGSTGV
jgi:dUTP pyrophosphatase